MIGGHSACGGRRLEREATDWSKVYVPYVVNVRQQQGEPFVIETNELGDFRNASTGEVFSVVRDVTKVPHTVASTGKTQYLDGSINYHTSCGVELNPASSDETRFANLDGELLVKVL